MTREEAIKELQESLDTLREYDIAHSSRLKQALEMAIKALSQESKSPCDLCRYNPPSSTDGKSCTMCPAEGRAH